MLHVLVTNAGKVLTPRQLLREVWGMGYEQEMHMLRVNISNLRRKIEPDPSRPRYVVTESGLGYRLRAKVWDWRRNERRVVCPYLDSRLQYPR